MSTSSSTGTASPTDRERDKPLIRDGCYPILSLVLYYCSPLTYQKPLHAGSFRCRSGVKRGKSHDRLSWITTTPTAVLMVVLSALGIYLTVVLFTRLAGLRSFSKMSSFDFAITVSIGAIIASTLLAKNPPLLQGVIGLAMLYTLQVGVSALRQRFDIVSRMVDNDPVLLMAGPEMLHENMKAARVTGDDLRAKLREANVIHLSQVRAVVLESTGDLSVLHADPDGPDLDPDLFSGVRDADRLYDRPNIQPTGG